MFLTNCSEFLVQGSLPISGQVDRLFATEAVDLSSIPGRIEPLTLKLVFIASLFNVQH